MGDEVMCIIRVVNRYHVCPNRHWKLSILTNNLSTLVLESGQASNHQSTSNNHTPGYSPILALLYTKRTPTDS